uniref:Uncharacterized protein n=1 Tax=Rhizophora mucronata TaxID=61149 RepID=A0A2P2IP62_RHIMU
MSKTLQSTSYRFVFSKLEDSENGCGMFLWLS